MGIFGFLKRRRDARFIAAQAEAICQRSLAPVMERVRRRAATMRSAEARGYIRARSLEIVHRELKVAHQGRIALAPAMQTEIISRATEALIVRAMAELRALPPTARAKRAA